MQAAAIATIERSNGLQLTLHNGQRVRSLAFGPSLFAMISGNRRSRKTATKLDQWLAQSPTHPHPASTEPDLHASIRNRQLLTGLAVFATPPLLGILTHLIITL